MGDSKTNRRDLLKTAITILGVSLIPKTGFSNTKIPKINPNIKRIIYITETDFKLVRIKNNKVYYIPMQKIEDLNMDSFTEYCENEYVNGYDLLMVVNRQNAMIGILASDKGTI